MHRREFFKGVGFAVLTVQCLPLMAESADDLVIQSGPGLFGHVHDLLIPYKVLNAPPPQGIKLTSTQAMWHQHDISLTRQELVTVKQGGAVRQKASSHVFVIALARK